MYQRCIKRILDFIFATILLIVLSPIMLIAAIAIKLDDPKGPVLFKQERVGKDGRIFKIYKFRTMVDGAINMGSGLHTDEGDPRITRIGKILRKTSLDELPQLINILKGEMSLIGPRPPVPYYPRKYEEYTTEQKRRFTVRPGISGYAQVVLRNSATWDERIELDLEYINKMSFAFDLYIFFMSILVVLKRKNVYAPLKSTNINEKS
ncbi:sugar transferase [Tepidanaerobacter acetatoxydans]|uniref:sugar transferase n=1 Tax=Tepidanaerobacter acetatoxydans TaxID=499229 RepID=UPI001BD34C73|nr:sugar transferase [Tepidanaerobacter acetatoxydans]